MIVRCWGARGSIPVSGSAYLRYGGDTTALEIRSRDNDIILVDAGSGIRRLGNQLMTETSSRYAMIFTHAHWDHLMGFPFFKPLYLSRTEVDLYGCSYTGDSLGQMISRVMEAPHFPVAFRDIKGRIAFHEICRHSFSIGPVTITPIPLSHPNQGLGFRFEEGGRRFVFLTDNELSHGHPGALSFEAYREFSRGADLLIHDAEFTEEEYEKTRTWGHSTYQDALRLALAAGVRSLGLFHHNQDRTDSALDGIITNCRRIIEEKKGTLDCFALSQTTEIHL